MIEEHIILYFIFEKIIIQVLAEGWKNVII